MRDCSWRDGGKGVFALTDSPARRALPLCVIALRNSLGQIVAVTASETPSAKRERARLAISLDGGATERLAGWAGLMIPSRVQQSDRLGPILAL